MEAFAYWEKTRVAANLSVEEINDIYCKNMVDSSEDFYIVFILLYDYDKIYMVCKSSSKDLNKQD